MSSNSGVTHLTPRQTTSLLARTWLFLVCVIYFISTSAGSARQRKKKKRTGKKTTADIVTILHTQRYVGRSERGGASADCDHGGKTL